MSDDVQFDMDSGIQSQYVPVRTSRIVQFVIKYSGGLIQNEKQANHAILGFIVSLFILSLILILSGSDGAIIPDEVFPAI